MMKEGDVIVVWFSCGAASAVAAKRTIQLYGNMCTVRVVNNPIAEEDEDNRRFLQDVEKWLGVTIEYALHEKYPSGSVVQIWDDVKYMSGVGGAPCTRIAKKEARQQWEAKNHHDWMVMGFTLDEKKRSDRFIQTERSNVLPVLINEQLTKDDCFAIIGRAGIDLPRVYHQGYPNANCIGCVKATSPNYWNHVRAVHPDVFASRAEQSRRIGAKLVRHQGERIFLDELPEFASTPRLLKTMNIECGLFCEMPEKV